VPDFDDRVRQLVQGRHFYVLLPIAICGDNWPEKLRTELAKKKFNVTFMYGYADGVGARIVFAVKNNHKPVISTVGLATLIAQIFPWSAHRTDKSRTHVPLISLPNAAYLAIALAHVGCKRISLSGERDHFTLAAGDIGCDTSCMATEMTRASSFPRILNGFVAQLPDDTLRKSVKERISRNMHGRSLKLPFGLHLPTTGSLLWNSHYMMALHASGMFQVPVASCFSVFCEHVVERG
jgi:hypothetical protein